jgi:hypothetical protein
MTASQPWINDTHVAYIRALRIRSHGNDPSSDLVPWCAWQCDTAVGDFHHLPAPHIIFAFPEVQIGMTHAAMCNFDDDFGPGRLGRWNIDFLERRTSFDNCPCLHVCILLVNIIADAAFMQS